MVTSINIKDVLNLFSAEQVDTFLKKYTNYTLNEKHLDENDISKNWKFLGGNFSNLSSIGLLTNAENGIIERLTNAIDAVIEKQKEKNLIFEPKNAQSIIEKSFPLFYEKYASAKSGNEKQITVCDANDQIILAINDSSKINQPTFDIVDKGIGVNGPNFKSTLLSLSGGNKISADKKYLIGTFGQGGSTSLPFAKSTIIISNKNGELFFTIIKKVFLKNYKTPSYMYLTFEDEILKLTNSNLKYNSEKGSFNEFEDYVYDFVNSESGTLVRMIETDISKNLINNDITKPGMLIDYLNTKLFTTNIPIKIMEKRKRFEENDVKQNRYAYGEEIKLKTWTRNVPREYMGTIDLDYNNKTLKVDYFVVLPTDETKWGSETERKKTYRSFNYLLDPIIYTVNGQVINTETYGKLKNAGLTFLKYSLLIVINLDCFEDEKYEFITSSRSQIKETNLTKRLLNNVLEKIASNNIIKEINDKIAEKTISTNSLSKEELEELSSEVKNIYSEMLKSSKNISYLQKNKAPHFTKNDEEIFSDSIDNIKISSKQALFYADEGMKFILQTGARKSANQNANISGYIDDHEYRDFSPDFMNGRISYLSQINKGVFTGVHEIYFMLFKENSDFLTTDKFSFEVSKEFSPNKILKAYNKGLDLEIKTVEEGTELISNLEMNKINKKITIYINLENEKLKTEIYRRMPNNSSDKVNQVKKEIIKPIALFTLWLKDFYEEQNPDSKNKMIVSHVKSIVFNSKYK